MINMEEMYGTIMDNMTLMSLEEEKMLREGFTRESLDHSALLISPEIKWKLESNALFGEVLTTALTEISSLLDKEIGKNGYIIEIGVVQDYEYPDWRDNVITIKVPIKDPKHIIKLWSVVSNKVWEKVGSIKEDAGEIKKISDSTRIAFDIL
jgi:hypothetical protein